MDFSPSECETVCEIVAATFSIRTCSTIMIQSPFTVAHLPVPAKDQVEKVYVADVIAITGSQKRKRSELAVAIDGEAINIYDVTYHVSTTREQDN